MPGKITKTIKVALCVAVAFSFLAVQSANAITIELALMLDGSNSLTDADWDLQVNAYRSIFNDNFMDNYVIAGDELWVTVYQFSTAVTNEIAMQQISTNTEAGALGDAIALLTQDKLWTNTTGAVNDAVAELTTNAIASDNMIIDVSTDGLPCLDGDCDQDTRDAAIAASAAAYLADVTVNALGVGMGGSGSTGDLFLDAFTAAGGGFKITATDYTQFEDALTTKLYREVHGIPDPGTVFLLGSACLIGFAGLRRKFKE